jgi:germination protein YpeB
MDEETLQRLYERAHGIKADLGAYAANMKDTDLRDFIKKGEGAMKDLFTRLEDLTLPENATKPGIMPKMDGAGKERTPITAEEGGSPAITPAQAEEMCKTYFSEYKINEFQCVGETVARGYTAYNVQGYDDNGTLLFAELDYKNGELIRFDYYEPCEGENFDMDNAQTLADNFLEKLGYDGLTAQRARENGTDVDFTYVYERDGVVYYPDMVHVKVCRARGVVTGFDCSKYLKNHTNRPIVKTSISQDTAQNKLHKDIEVESARLAVVQTMRGERAAYEFVCSYKGERYVIYTDANTGEELSILNVNALG